MLEVLYVTERQPELLVLIPCRFLPWYSASSVISMALHAISKKRNHIVHLLLHACHELLN